MKTLLRVIQLLFTAGGKTDRNTPKHARLENSGPTPDPAAPQPERVSFADDDSPPGQKIRWHC
jgi:hypothetical protein